jgi:hypothetical protein
MQSVQAFKSRRIALLGEPDCIRFRQFARFGVSRSGHATRRDASHIAMRLPPQKLYLLVPPAQPRQKRTGIGELVWLTGIGCEGLSYSYTGILVGNGLGVQWRSFFEYRKERARVTVARPRRRKGADLGGYAVGAGPGARAGAQELVRREIFQFSAEAGDMAGGKRMEEGLQDDLRLAEASIKIVVLAFERPPARGRLGGQTLGNIGGRFAEFVFQLLEGGGENAELVKKSGTLSKEHMMKDAIPGGGALRGVAAEEFGSERLDGRQAGDVPAAVRQDRAEGSERPG